MSSMVKLSSLLANHQSRDEAVNLVIVYDHVNLPQGFALGRTDYHIHFISFEGFYHKEAI